MNLESRGSSVLWIELWHGLLVLALLVLLVPPQILEPWALLLGGVFMGLNFLLLSYGIRWVLTPFAVKGRVRAGLCLLILKLGLFLGLLSALFFRFELDGPSFAVGISCLLVAIILESFWACQRVSE